MFDKVEEVSLCPTVFMAICQTFEVYPEIDLFASKEQHHLARYCTADHADAQAEGYNDFNFRYTSTPPGPCYPKWWTRSW